VEIPTEVVDRDFIANVNNGEKIIRGPELEEGMIVLIEGSLQKHNPTADYEAARALKTNRWCSVSDLSFEDLGESGALVRFTGYYANGDIMERHYNAQYSWVVKVDSIPAPSTELTTFESWARGLYTPVTGPFDTFITTPHAHASWDNVGLNPMNFEEEQGDADTDWAPMQAQVTGWIVGEVDPALEALIHAEEEAEGGVTWNPNVEDLP